MRIADTTRDGDIIVHHAVVTSGTVSIGQTIRLEVDAERRLRTARNHSATHLLQAALRDVLGDHVEQRGSLVTPDRLRFDFHHDSPIAAAELHRVESLVNGWIRDDLAQTTEVTTYEQAVAAGATALFDAYGEAVRMVDLCAGHTTPGPFVSRELCGGTHIRATGQIGLFLIVDERSVGRATRRIEALTGDAAVAHTLDAMDTLASLARTLRTPLDAVEAAVNRLVRAADPAPAVTDSSDANETVVLREETIAHSAGLRVAIAHLDTPPAALSDVAEAHLRTQGYDAILAATVREGKLTIVAISAPAAQPTLPASQLLRAVLPLVDGRGGGNARIAMGGSRDPERLADLLAHAAGALKSS